MEQVKDVHGFWNFTENDLLDGLYSEDWYNEGTARCLRIYQNISMTLDTIVTNII